MVLWFSGWESLLWTLKSPLERFFSSSHMLEANKCSQPLLTHISNQTTETDHKKEWSTDKFNSMDEPRNTIQSGRSQTQTVTYWMIPFIWNTQNRQTHKDIKQIGDYQGMGGWGGEEWLLKVYGVFFGSDENVLKLDRGGSCIML